MTASDLIVPAVSTIIGAAVSYFALDKRQAVSEAVLTTQLAAVEKTLAEMKSEHLRSATEQGFRLGELKDDVGTLKDFKARVEGAQQHERDFSGVVRNR